MCVLGTFSEYTVVPTASVIKVEQGIALDKAALVGCGVTTGYGSAVRAGETAMVAPWWYGRRGRRDQRGSGRADSRRAKHRRPGPGAVQTPVGQWSSAPRTSVATVEDG